MEVLRSSLVCIIAHSLYKGSNSGGAKNCKNHKMPEFLSLEGANKVNLHDLGISTGGANAPLAPLLIQALF